MPSNLAELSFNEIHPTAVVLGSLGTGNVIGPFCSIGPRVTIGNDNVFSSHCCIGSPGQYRGKTSKGSVIIGDDNVFREFSTVHEAMDPELTTRVGNNGYFMANAHIAHDCHIENDVTMANNATLGGGVYLMTGANLGFGATVHQGQVIGSYAMLGMGAIVPKHAKIKPGCIYAGNPVRYLRPNAIGLERAKVGEGDLFLMLERWRLLSMGWQSA
jgi:UDP-N-acetylglucosamine acyltransferase